MNKNLLLDKKTKQLQERAEIIIDKIEPLLYENKNLKEQIIATNHYLEESRNNFSQLVKQFDQYGSSRELVIKIGDLPAIYQALKQDVDYYTQIIIEYDSNNKNIQNELDDIREEKKTLFQKIRDDFQKQIMIYKEEISRLMDQNSQKNKQLNQLNEKFQEQKNIISDNLNKYEKEIKKQESFYLAINQKLQGKIDSQSVEIINLNLQIQEAHKQFEQQLDILKIKNELYIKELKAAYDSRIEKISSEWQVKFENENKQKNELRIQLMSERGIREKLENQAVTLLQSQKTITEHNQQLNKKCQQQKETVIHLQDKLNSLIEEQQQRELNETQQLQIFENQKSQYLKTINLQQNQITALQLDINMHLTQQQENQYMIMQMKNEIESLQIALDQYESKQTEQSKIKLNNQTTKSNNGNKSNQQQNGFQKQQHTVKVNIYNIENSKNKIQIPTIDTNNEKEEYELRFDTNEDQDNFIIQMPAIKREDQREYKNIEKIKKNALNQNQAFIKRLTNNLILKQDIFTQTNMDVNDDIELLFANQSKIDAIEGMYKNQIQKLNKIIETLHNNLNLIQNPHLIKQQSNMQVDLSNLYDPNNIIDEYMNQDPISKTLVSLKKQLVQTDANQIINSYLAVDINQEENYLKNLQYQLKNGLQSVLPEAKQREINRKSNIEEQLQIAQQLELDDQDKQNIKQIQSNINEKSHSKIKKVFQTICQRLQNQVKKLIQIIKVKNEEQSIQALEIKKLQVMIKTYVFQNEIRASQSTIKKEEKEQIIQTLQNQINEYQQKEQVQSTIHLNSIPKEQTYSVMYEQSNVQMESIPEQDIQDDKVEKLKQKQVELKQMIQSKNQTIEKLNYEINKALSIIHYFNLELENYKQTYSIFNPLPLAKKSQTLEKQESFKNIKKPTQIQIKNLALPKLSIQSLSPDCSTQYLTHANTSVIEPIGNRNLFISSANQFLQKLQKAPDKQRYSKLHQTIQNSIESLKKTKQDLKGHRMRAKRDKNFKLACKSLNTSFNNE